jgi:hypothetical protein
MSPGPLLHSALLYFSRCSLLDLLHFNGVGGYKEARFRYMCRREYDKRGEIDGTSDTSAHVYGIGMEQNC